MLDTISNGDCLYHALYRLEPNESLLDNYEMIWFVHEDVLFIESPGGSIDMYPVELVKNVPITSKFTLLRRVS